MYIHEAILEFNDIRLVSNESSKLTKERGGEEVNPADVDCLSTKQMKAAVEIAELLATKDLTIAEVRAVLAAIDQSIDYNVVFKFGES